MVAELGCAGVATVYEAAGRRGLIDGPWDLVTPGRRVAGPAVTALCEPGDNRAVHEAVTMLAPGDMLVVASEEPAPVALVGDLLATQIAARGAVGVLVDAAVRDTAELAAMPVAVSARWRHALGATKEFRGAVGKPVTVGGTRIDPGDIVVVDGDGAVVVRRDEVTATVVAVRERILKEAGLRARWANGELSYDVYGMRAEDEGVPASGNNR